MDTLTHIRRIDYYQLEPCGEATTVPCSANRIHEVLVRLRDNLERNGYQVVSDGFISGGTMTGFRNNGQMVTYQWGG